MATTGKNIRQLREDVFKEKRDVFAKRFGISGSTVRDWEQGHLKVSIVRLIEFTKISPPPLCWKFLEAADLTRKDIDRMLAGKVARPPKKKT